MAAMHTRPQKATYTNLYGCTYTKRAESKRGSKRERENENGIEAAEEGRARERTETERTSEFLSNSEHFSFLCIRSLDRKQ